MKKNILIIDDSALIRRVLSDIINTDERFQVKDIAGNGLAALDLIVKQPTAYDVVILDINMPRMGGLEFLEQLNKNGIRIRVIVVSTVAKEGAKETIRALELGAFDFVTKPDSLIEAKSETFQEKIIEKLVVATQYARPLNFSQTLVRKADRTKASAMPKPAIRPSSMIKKGGKKLIALACSTGGPKALQSVIPYLPEKLDASVLVVQHMPEGFTNSLATRLNEMSKIKVKEASDGEVIEKGVVYIAKGGSQLRLKNLRNSSYKLSITVEPPRNGLRPCADIMYESLVTSEFDEITCVVLTGMGADGTQGIKQLSNKKRVYVIAQNEETCTVYGMPKVIAESGLVNEVVPLTSVADAITRKVGVQ